MTTNNYKLPEVDLWPAKPAESLSINQLKALQKTFDNLVNASNACLGAARSNYQARLGELFSKWGDVIIQAALNNFEGRPFGLIEARKNEAEKAKEFDYRRHAEIVRGIGISMQNAEGEAEFKEHYYRLMDECGVLQAGVSKDCPRDFFNRYQIIKGKRIYTTQIKELANSIHYNYKGPTLDA